jgi:hypothetical protein
MNPLSPEVPPTVYQVLVRSHTRNLLLSANEALQYTSHLPGRLWQVVQSAFLYAQYILVSKPEIVRPRADVSWYQLLLFQCDSDLGQILGFRFCSLAALGDYDWSLFYEHIAANRQLPLKVFACSNVRKGFRSTFPGLSGAD